MVALRLLLLPFGFFFFFFHESISFSLPLYFSFKDEFCFEGVFGLIVLAVL